MKNKESENLKKMLEEVSDLEELNKLLTHIAIYEVPRGKRLDEVIDLTNLPTFGGKFPNDTLGVFSWDFENLLVAGVWGFEIEPRCARCGEATFNCGHFTSRE